jgi:hypothetical protein
MKRAVATPVMPHRHGGMEDALAAGAPFVERRPAAPEITGYHGEPSRKRQWRRKK